MARTREFDTNEVLDKAMRLFWEKGYGATSMAELEKGLGINKFSIYNTFGNKHELFLAALSHYDKSMTNQLLQTLSDEPSGLAAIDRALDMLEKKIQGDSRRFGCLMLNSGIELSPHDAEVSTRVQNMNRSLEDAFYESLAVAQQRGEIANNINLKEYARFLLTLYQGMITVAKVEQDSRTVHSSISFAKQMLRRS